VKQYTLANAERYQKAIKNTGPIDNAKLYSAHVKKNPEPFIMNIDDPYWRDMMDKNWRRADQWRLPSMMAWDHKPHGILDEIFDMKKMQEIMQ
jgi:hypothetical protein